MAESKAKWHDPDEVEGLVERAKTGDVDARNELITRFQRLVASLVQVCITGRPNYWSPMQIKFLRIFSPNVPVEDTAAMLKNKLSSYTKEELFSAGYESAFRAVENTKENYSRTIVYNFKDKITEMIKDPINNYLYELQEGDTVEDSFEGTVSVNLFLETLNEAEKEIADRIISGEKVRKKDIPVSLKKKMKKYLGYDPVEIK